MAQLGYVTHIGMLGGGGMVLGSDILNFLAPAHMDLRNPEEQTSITIGKGGLAGMIGERKRLPPLMTSNFAMVYPYALDSHPLDAGQLGERDKAFASVLMGGRAEFGGSVGAGGDPEHCMKDIILPNKDLYLGFLKDQFRSGTSNVILMFSADGGSGKALFDFHMDSRKEMIPKEYAGATWVPIVATPYNLDARSVVKGGTSTRGQTSAITLAYLASLVKHEHALTSAIIVDNDYSLLNYDQNFRGKPIAPLVKPTGKVIMNGDFGEMRKALAVNAAYKNSNTSILAALAPIILLGVRGGKKSIRVGEKAATGWDIADFTGQHKDGFVIPSYIALGSRPAIEERLHGFAAPEAEDQKIGALGALLAHQALAPFTKDSIRSIQFVIWSPYQGTDAQGISAAVKESIDSTVSTWLQRDDLKISQLVMYGEDPLGGMDRAYMRIWAYFNVDPEQSVALFKAKYQVQ
jgi:hypothetical protein